MCLMNLRQNLLFFHSSFTTKVSDLSVDIHLRITDLQFDSDFKDRFASVSLDTFLSVSLTRISQTDSPGRKSFVHVCNNFSL